MEFLFDNQRPIYLQLLEILRTAIVSGTIAQGEKLPSVRELALQAQVNPNTVQKALAQLESEGLIFTERTNGKFVSADKEAIRAAKEQIARQKAAAYLEQMQQLGYTQAEAIEHIKNAK